MKIDPERQMGLRGAQNPRAPFAESSGSATVEAFTPS